MLPVYEKGMVIYMQLICQVAYLISDLIQVFIILTEVFKISIELNRKKIYIVILVAVVLRIMAYKCITNESIAVNSSLILIGTIVLILFKGSKIRNIILCFTSYVAASGIDYAIYYLSYVADRVIDSITISDPIHEALGNIGGTFVICLAIGICKSLLVRRKNLNIPDRIYLFISIAIISITFIVGGSLRHEDETANNSSIYHLLYLVVFLVIMIGSYVLMVLYCEHEEYKLKERQHAEHIDKLQSYYQNLMKRDLEIKQFRHDYKNHIMSLRILAHHKKYKDLDQYLQDISINDFMRFELIDVKNDLANAILNNYAAVSKENGINMSVKGTFPENLSISNYDICTLLSNSLDNAFIATEQCEQKGRNIVIIIKNIENKIVFEIMNSVSNVIPIMDGCILTTKSNRKNHGFGIINMRKSAEKYYGCVEYKMNEEMMQLETRIMLRNERPLTP